jgi:hypothetical protein
LTSVLFCDAPEVDVEDLQGFGATRPMLTAAPAEGAAVAAPPEVVPAAPKPPAASDPVQSFRRALAAEIAAALAAGTAFAPIGKWLSEDLIFTADRLSEGIARRGADLLGIPETTYRRQLQAATRHRAAGLLVRSERWPALAETLEEFIRARRGDADVCQWAETCLLEEIEAASPGDARVAAALLGVTEPTLWRRRAERIRQFS